MQKIQLTTNDVKQFVTEAQLEHIVPEAEAALKTVNEGTGAGNDFLGWTDLPTRTGKELLDEIQAAAQQLRDRCEVVVSIGIGGSYLGAKAVIEALGSNLAALEPGRIGAPKVLFAGHNIGEDYMYDLLKYLEGKQFGIIVISKSGTTTEPAIAFRLLKERLEQAVGRQEAAKRIIAVTDAKRGALRKLATDEGYKTFVIEDAVGGRYSVLTPCGLVPIAVAGFDIHKLVEGARHMQERTLAADPDNISLQYAAVRNVLYRSGKKIEILVNYNPRLHYVAEWWKQLYGESEGKDNRGIFPTAVDNSTDLHSMGQWIQEGERSIFETVLSVDNTDNSVVIPSDEANLDALNYLAGKHIDEVNKMAELGTRLAHLDGGVPQLRVTIPRIDAYNLGSLFYFFEKACGISGYLLGVNPFNQPGVEAYKRNMFALLAKPGYEAETQAISKRIK